jgi:hypothetical protein
MVYAEELNTTVLVSRCLADEELICKCYLLGRGKNAHTDTLRKERL